MGKYVKQSSKTRKKIIQAFLDLCQEKGYYNITLKELCERAELYKSTFYRYFDNLDCVIKAIEDDFLMQSEQLLKETGSLLRNRYISGQSPESILQDKDIFQGYQKLLTMMFDNRKELLFLLSDCQGSYFHSKYKKWISQHLMQHAKSQDHTNPYIEIPVAFLVNGYVGSLCTLLNQSETVNDALVKEFIRITLMSHYYILFE